MTSAFDSNGGMNLRIMTCLSLVTFRQSRLAKWQFPRCKCGESWRWLG
jgi:hypothetical protein